MVALEPHMTLEVLTGASELPYVSDCAFSASFLAAPVQWVFSTKVLQFQVLYVLHCESHGQCVVTTTFSWCGFGPSRSLGCACA